jgi:tRNA (guanosine-2'-O-)-methyltransferase
MIEMNIEEKRKLLEYLSGFITDNKKRKIEEIIALRTKYLCVVLEDIYQPHNASAVLRSCDCFGIQDLHIIENRNKYTVNPDIALGSSKWVNIIKHNGKEHNTEDCLNDLKRRGYKIVATMPDEHFVTLEELKLDKKVALMFGTEQEGLSDIAIKNADEFVRIKMYGFTESFNISVSAALCLHYLSSKLRSSEIDWKLTEEDRIETQLYWVKNIVKSADLLEKDFLQKHKV